MTTKKPEPVAYVRSDELSRLGCNPSFGVHNKANSILLRAVTKDQAEKYGHDVALVTESDMESYAQALVDAALEEAAKVCWNMQSKPEFGLDRTDRHLAIAEKKIRALIPQIKPSSR